MEPAVRSACLLRLRRIAGQVRGIERMLHDRRSCRAILEQLQAVRGALHVVETQLIADFAGQIVEEGAAAQAASPPGKLGELLALLRRDRPQTAAGSESDDGCE